MIVNVASLLSFVMLLAIGQFLFKHSALAIAGMGITDALLTLIRLPVYYAAIALYAGSTVAWIWILTRVPLSLAYPFVALCLVVVPILGWYFFGERLTGAYWIGAAFIITGMLIMQLAS